MARAGFVDFKPSAGTPNSHAALIRECIVRDYRPHPFHPQLPRIVAPSYKGLNSSQNDTLGETWQIIEASVSSRKSGFASLDPPRDILNPMYVGTFRVPTPRSGTPRRAVSEKSRRSRNRHVGPSFSRVLGRDT
eukprot:CAMPEP_0204424646 /NCGR_PEP_ID=MMETSP0470-20130426/46253_1 /ASSEMBLY_ACC=CAM_ASM_000385 /TAXON_ID=2969 /ORGANISM="Oxyrrhis marina" /LENGTH=133 /DNA_ID=CAMNT_0051422175 /DNA_START=47 /DNA_END=448 /DNA_ORIENTATION=+